VGYDSNRVNPKKRHDWNRIPQGNDETHTVTEPAIPDPPPPNAKKKNYLWVGYFAFLLIASVSVTVFMIWFNLRVQLKPEQLEAANEVWKQKGPKNYNMVYTKQVAKLNSNDKFAVKVRNGNVTEVMMNDKPLKWKKEDGQTDDPLLYHSMDSIYRDMQRFMDLDQKDKSKRVYVIANFDNRNGAVIKYIRSVMGTVDRVEYNISLTAVSE